MTTKVHPAHWKKATAIHESDLTGEWRDIVGFGGQYRISINGVVISSRRRGLVPGWWAVVAIRKSRLSNPFNRVSLTVDGPGPRQRSYMLARLLLEAFVGPAPSPTSLAAHRNGKSDDDRLDNLMWAESADVTHGRICRGSYARGSTSPHSRYSLEQVEAARKIVIEHGVSANLLATAMGIKQPRVREWLVKTWDDSKWDGLINPLTDEVLDTASTDMVSKVTDAGSHG